MRGTAGDQAVVRVRSPLDLNRTTVTLHADAGSFAGFALVPHGRARPSLDRFAYALAGTPKWTCGAQECPGGEPVFTYTPPLPSGDYVLALLGDVGAKVRVTVTPAARGRKVTPVTPTARSRPVVAPAGGSIPDLPAEPYAKGSFDTAGHGTGFVGLLHTFDVAAAGPARLAFGVGWGAGRNCDVEWSGSRGGDPGIVTRQTNAIGAPSDAGTTLTCGTWEGTAPGLTTQRALGFYVPFIAR